MKRKRGKAKSKPKISPLSHVDEVIQSVVRDNTREFGLDDNDQVRERVETEMEERRSNRSNQQDSKSPFIEPNVVASRSFSKKSCSKPINSPLNSGANQVHNKNLQQQESAFPHQDLQCKNQELEAALSVIRKVMEMDAAAPFNLPVDPVALGIPDYFDIVEMPMDFSTVCNNLENDHNYQNSKDVLRDVQLIWDNCIKYNKKGHYILELLKKVKKKFMILWTEAGLFTDQQPEINGVLADRGKYSHRDQVDLSRHHSNQPALSYTQSYQPQQRPFLSPPRSPEPLARRTVDSFEASRRWNPHGHGYQMDATDIISTHTQFQHQYPMGNCNSHQPYEKSCICHPNRDHSQHSHQIAGKFIDSADHSHIPSMREPSARRMEASQPQHHLHQPSVHCSQQYQTQEIYYDRIPTSGRQLFSHSVADSGNCAHQKHDQSSYSYGHHHQPMVESFRGMSGTRKRPSLSSKSHAGIEMGNAEEEFRSPPLPDSMIRYMKPGPTKYRPIHLAGVTQLKNKKAVIPKPSDQPTLIRAGQVERRMVDQSSRPVRSTSDEPHADVDMDSSDEFISPPPAESMISCAKHGPTTVPADAIPDIISHQQPEETPPTQIQPQKNLFEAPPSSSQPQPSNPQVPQGMLGAGSSEVKKRGRGRGPNRCLEVWNNEAKIPVSTNEFGQPIGPDAPKFICFLGTVARNGLIAPLNYMNWKAVPDENKEKMWQLVEAKFLIDPLSKDSILKSIGTKWKNWKAFIKANHYSPHETDEERLADCDERVQPDQWRILVSYWNSNEAQKKSNINKANRSKYTSNHAAGSKSFARVREEQRLKRPEGKEPSKADLFIVTRTRKNGQPVNEASSAIISQLREAAQQKGVSEKDTIEDDIFVKVIGEETPGHIRIPGVGPTISNFSTSKPLPIEAVRVVSEAKAEVREMKEKMVSMEQTCAQMAAQIATMMIMMQNKFSEKDNCERSEHSFSSSRDGPSLRGPTTRSERK